MRPYRKAVYECLNGNINYNATNIPVFDEKVPAGNVPQHYVLLGTQRQSDITDQDCYWIHRSSIDIVIVGRSDFETSKDAIDDISNTIYGLLLNSPGSDNLPAQSGYTFNQTKIESAVAGPVEINQTTTILQKVITLTSNIIEQS